MFQRLMIPTLMTFGLFALELSYEMDSWIKVQKTRSFKYLLENISRKDTPQGFIVASPSKYNPDYYYHWVRDAALVMRSLDQYLEFNNLKVTMFHDYIQWVKYAQSQTTLSGLGEPKFNPDGSGYTLPWGRPQNDGPALRALTLIHYAHTLLDLGHEDYVREHLYNGEMPARTVIKKDLEYVSHEWRKKDFDLWEEVKGHHFYTKMVQRAALFLGAKLAARLEDQGASDWYFEQASLINHYLDSFYDEKKGYIITTQMRSGGLPYKYSNLDSSVILAVNHASLSGMSFSHLDPRVDKTFYQLKTRFKALYKINHNPSLGVAVGRYPEDRYFGGHPWFITTNAMAEFLIKKAILKEKKNINSSRGELYEAQSFLKRVKKHMSTTGRMDEQFHRDNGFMLAAPDLTWSYSSFLTIGVKP